MSKQEQIDNVDDKLSNKLDFIIDHISGKKTSQ